MGIDLPYSVPVSLPTRKVCSTHLLTMGNLPFRVMVKPLFDLCGIQHFEQSVELPFVKDGYVFTNLYSPAYPFRMKKESVFKWKPRNESFSENTIDFIVENKCDTFVPLAQQFESKRWSKQYDIDMSVVERFRTMDLMTHDDNVSVVYLYTVLPDKTRFCFASAYVNKAVTCGHVYECQWNYQSHMWSVVRLRKKSPNNWTTVVGTVQNIVEDIQLDELTTNNTQPDMTFA